jgi:hypothetical protein
LPLWRHGLTVTLWRHGLTVTLWRRELAFSLWRHGKSLGRGISRRVLGCRVAWRALLKIAP